MHGGKDYIYLNLSKIQKSYCNLEAKVNFLLDINVIFPKNLMPNQIEKEL